MLDFSHSTLRTTQFGIGRLEDTSRRFYFIPAGGDVQNAVWRMVVQTTQVLTNNADRRSVFDPADKHERREHLYVPIGDELASPLRLLHDAENLMVDSHSLDDPGTVFCYFVRLTDDNGRRVTGVRRAAQFKAVRRENMLQIFRNELRLATEPMFQLNDEFDFIIDSRFVHILNPAGFRALAQVDSTLQTSVRKNVSAISAGVPFADWSGVEAYAQGSPRAAALLASIRTNRFYEGIDQALLVRLCRSTGVEIEEISGKLTVSERSVLGFLEVLDRRRYEIQVVKDSAEQYKAASRKKIA